MLALMAFVAGSMNAKVKVRQTPAYLFGYALSPVDSVVYLTSIQRVDTVYMEKKTKMLMGRSLYSDQLQQYLENSMGVRGAICAVFLYCCILTARLICVYRSPAGCFVCCIRFLFLTYLYTNGLHESTQ